MRISDWSSDVCSSDHDLRAARVGIAGQSRALLPPLWPVLRRGVHLTLVPVTLVVMMAVFGFSPLKAAVWTVAVNVALYFTAVIVLAGERSAALRAGAALVAAHADRQSTRLHSRHLCASSMPSSACYKKSLTAYRTD